jgi:protein-tyrosine-phosphatase
VLRPGGLKPLNVLFLCTGNSASAGSHPAGKVNPFALELLEKNRLPSSRIDLILAQPSRN